MSHHRCASLMGGVALSAVCASQASAAEVAFNIPSGPLPAALQAFGLQSGAPIVFNPSSARSIISPGAVGIFEPSEALNRLLAGSRLNYVRAGRAFTVVSSPDPPVRPPREHPMMESELIAAAGQPAPSLQEAVSEVVVTGSRVITSGAGSPSPLTMTFISDLLDLQPSSMAQGLNILPSVLGSITATSNVNTAGPNTVNLRGVGTLRALVLFDGHRVGPTQANGAVSIDVVPQMMLKRADLVTGGASAVYGSDAVSGVLNFVTDNKFMGLKFNIQDGQSEYGDDNKLDVGIAVGRDLVGGRGHFEASYQHRRSAGALRSDRPFFDAIWTEQGAVIGAGPVGTADNPYKLVAHAVVATASFGGQINSGPLGGLNFTTDGQLSPFVHGAPTGTAGVEIGGQGAYYTRSTIDLPQNSQQQFARFDFDFSRDFHGFVQAAATQANYLGIGQNWLLSRVAIGYNNAYLSTLQPQYRALVVQQLANDPQGSFQFSKMDTVYPNTNTRNHEGYYVIQLGLSGSVESFNWEAGYVHTDSRYRSENPNGIDNARLFAALNAVVDPASGQVMCHAALVNPSAYGGCVPLNVFGPTAESAAALAYIRHVPHSAQLYASDDVGGTIRGAPLTLPAGPVNMALSAEWRKLTFEVQSDSPPTSTVNCAGIEFNCTATISPFMGGQTSVLSPVDQTVTEVAYEADLPVLADLAYAQSFNLNSAVRFTDYNTSGSVWTWKIGGLWRINDEVLVRATRSRDIRAPNLNELFAPRAVGLNQYVDIHTGASGVVANVTQGNRNLKPEKADTTTAGIVWRSRSVDGFSLSVDGYRIRINAAVVGIPAFQPATQRACELSNGAAEVCALYVRPFPFSNRTAANYPTALLSQSLNVAALDTYGVDIEANYATTLSSGKLALRALFNWQPHLLYDNGPAGQIDIGGAADGVGALPAIPSTKLVISASYSATKALSFRIQERWRGRLDQNGTKGLYFADGKVPSVAYTDVNATYNLSKLAAVFVNVQNLFSADPPAWASAGGSLQPNYLGGFAQGDDIVGRYFTLGLRLSM